MGTHVLRATIKRVVVVTIELVHCHIVRVGGEANETWDMHLLSPALHVQANIYELLVSCLRVFVRDHE
jgi:hypothetical protein